jgi:hypothetical protein
MALNRELLALYWDIGRLILDRQRREGWGAKVIDRLALDLQRSFPGQQGFSRTNLLFMRAFADAWSEAPIVLQPVGGVWLADGVGFLGKTGLLGPESTMLHLPWKVA